MGYNGLEEVMLVTLTSEKTLTLNVNEVGINLPRLLERVRRGEEIIIAESGRPVARLVPVDQPSAQRVPGSAAGQIVIADDFDAPLPDSVLRAFEQWWRCWTPTCSCGGSLPMSRLLSTQ